MNLADFLTTEQIAPTLAAADRWSAIDQLVDVLVRAGKIPAVDRDSVRRAVRDREAQKGTGIGYGIALPHASVGGIKDVVAALGRLRPGVDFQALDGQPVTLCLLFLTPQGEFQKHLHALSGFARLLSSAPRRQALQAAQSAEDIFAVLRSSAA